MFKLLLGNKKYSSWSMRPYVALKNANIPFEDEVLRMRTPEFSERLLKICPVAKVPVLIDGEVIIWDSLAIIEYAHEKHPQSGIWPQDATARALARSLTAMMHSSFSALRTCYPMNVTRNPAALHSGPPEHLKNDLAKDIAVIQDIWKRALDQFGGPFLCGEMPCAVDAFYAPVCSRFDSYDVPLDDTNKHYVNTVLSLPSVQNWYRDGIAEPWLDDRYKL